MDRPSGPKPSSAKSIAQKKGEPKKRSSGGPNKSKRGSLEPSEIFSRLFDQHVAGGLTGKPLSLALKRDIPYLLPDFQKGTQVVSMRLYAGPFSLATVASTAFTTVQIIDANIFTNFTDMASVFDEYRFVHGHVWYTPSSNHAADSLSLATGYTIAVVDYANNGALASLAAALTHDNHREFYLVGVPSQQIGKRQCSGVASWPIIFEKLPDQEWNSTANGDVEVAYWKPYMASAQSPGTTETGKLCLWMDFQFRGMKP